ncbi:serine/threonine-protein kinase [Pseudonocardia acidicola]|uniref:serine/threonine-protein kinase n=1 Tax=Pseudonocardia acidicola TaxID=2724939 RepID=UPI001EF046B7|nr:serine/threonine-protein kinase [Pseudonocardia acidicola]
MTESTFGPYTIEGLLGRGGMGEVHRAYDTETDRVVALKLLPGHLAGDAEYLERFRRECRAAARLREPHVVPIHRFGEIDGRLYLDMRLVEGTDLGTWLTLYGPLPPEAAVAVISQIASALDAAHAEGLVHRDVKPSNVLLSGAEMPPLDAASVFAYLFDFGIAWSRDTAGGADAPALTKAGTMPGSIAYIAPERFCGAGADPRVDVYALTCVLHQALTGHQPYQGDLPTLLHAHLHLPPPRPSDTNPTIPSALDAVVARGMAKDPEQRYPTAGSLAAATRAALGAAAPAAHDSAPRTSLPGVGEQGPNGRPGEQVEAPPVAAGAPGGHGGPGGPGGPGDAAASDGSGGAGAGGGPSHPPTGSDPGPPAPRFRRLTGWTTIVVATVLVVTGGAVLVHAAGGTTGGGRSGTRAPSPTPTTLTSGTLTPQTRLLLGQLPDGFGPADCSPDGSMGGQPGATAYVVCDSGPPGGPTSATFTRYTTRDQMDQTFEQAAISEGIPGVPGKAEDCRAGTRVRAGYDRGAGQRGAVGCFRESPGGAGYLFWTDDAALAFGYVRAEDGDLAKLFDWWQSTGFTIQH